MAPKKQKAAKPAPAPPKMRRLSEAAEDRTGTVPLKTEDASDAETVACSKGKGQYNEAGEA